LASTDVPGESRQRVNQVSRGVAALKPTLFNHWIEVT
jgi:hypothetical protein